MEKESKNLRADKKQSHYCLPDWTWSQSHFWDFETPESHSERFDPQMKKILNSGEPAQEWPNKEPRTTSKATKKLGEKNGICRVTQRPKKKTTVDQKKHKDLRLPTSPHKKNILVISKTFGKSSADWQKKKKGKKKGVRSVKRD